MFEFLRKYQLSKAKEELAAAIAKRDAVQPFTARPTNSYFVDQWTKACERVARLEYKMKALTK